jgi:hypothetical protein
VVFRTSNGGYHLNYGRAIRVEKNVFAFGDDGQLRISHSEPQAVHLTNNIIEFDSGPLFVGNWTNDALGKNNIFHGRAVSDRDRAIIEGAKSVLVDPGFVDAKNGDFRLTDNAPAKQIQPAAPEQAMFGIQGTPEWIARAPSCASARSAVPH